MSLRRRASVDVNNDPSPSGSTISPSSSPSSSSSSSSLLSSSPLLHSAVPMLTRRPSEGAKLSPPVPRALPLRKDVTCDRALMRRSSMPARAGDRGSLQVVAFDVLLPSGAWVRATCAATSSVGHVIEQLCERMSTTSPGEQYCLSAFSPTTSGEARVTILSDGDASIAPAVEHASHVALLRQSRLGDAALTQRIVQNAACPASVWLVDTPDVAALNNVSERDSGRQAVPPRTPLTIRVGRGRVPPDVRQCCVRLALRRGVAGSVLGECEPSRCDVAPLADSVDWLHEPCSFDALTWADAPRDTCVEVQMSDGARTFAWCVVPLFDAAGRLKRGVQHLLLWPEPVQSTAMNVGGGSRAASLELLLDVDSDAVYAIAPPQPTELPQLADPLDALPLLAAAGSDPDTRAVAVRQLAAIDDRGLLWVLPQLLELLRYDLHHASALALLLLHRARTSRNVHQRLCWLLFVELKRCHRCDAQRFALLLEACLRHEFAAFDAQREWVLAIESVARGVQSGAGTQARNAALREQLRYLSRRLAAPIDCIFDAGRKLGALLVDQCRCLDSKKAPLWLAFADAADAAAPPICLLFKCGDDLRQDALVLGIIGALERLWARHELQLPMTPYACVATDVDCGFIECVVPAYTTAHITAQFGGALAALSDAPLLSWLTTVSATAATLQDAVGTFARSCAGYAVATYVLGIGDRHNDNVMVRPDGRLFHVDFGHFLGNYKKKLGIRRESAPFVLTKDFVRAIGTGASFERFVALGAAAYNVARANAPLLLALLRPMIGAQLPELRSADDLDYVVTALALELDPAAAAERWAALTQQALSAKSTLLNNVVHLAVRASDSPPQHSVQRALEALADARHGAPHDVVVRDSSEAASAVVALVNCAIASRALIGAVELCSLRHWSNECAQSVCTLLRAGSGGVGRLTLRNVALRDTVWRLLPETPCALTELDLSHCDIGDARLAALWPVVPRLTRLSLRHNRLTDAAAPLIGELLAMSTALLAVDLADNRLSESAALDVVREAQRTTTVREVVTDFSHIECSLRTRPGALVAPLPVARNLTALSLRGSQLTELSRAMMSALAECPLSELDVSFNRLTTLPASIGRLSKLTWFSARNNRLSSVPPFAGAAPLCTVDLSFNDLKVWPAALDAAALQHCRHLLLAHNQLRSVPSLMLASLPELRYLSLRDNVLERLPGALPSLLDATATATAMRELGNGGGPASCVRVMLLGKESTGKTTLARLLRDGKARAARDVSTDGVVVSPWAVRGEQMQLLLYDFGGQAVFYPTHAFFLSKRTVSLVVVNLADVDAASVNYWLQQVSQVGRPNRIIVVGTHADLVDDAERCLNELHRRVLYRYADLVDCHCVVSAKSRASVDVLRSAVLEAAAALAASYVERPCERALRGKLTALRQLHQTLSWDSYATLAAELHITHEALLDVTRSLHYAGALMWFETPSLRQTVILDAQFVADAMRTVVTFRHSFVHAGVVRDVDLRAALPAELSGALLGDVTRLLERFDVLCRLPPASDGLSVWLVPCLLPSAPPPVAVDSPPPPVAVWRRAWRFGALPPPPWFMPRIVSRALHAEGVVPISLWASGAVLVCAVGSVQPGSHRRRHELRVAIESTATQLSLSVRCSLVHGSARRGSSGNRPRRATAQVALLRLVQIIEQVLGQCDGARAGVVRDVLCNCAACAAHGATPTRFAAAECELAVANGATALHCRASPAAVLAVSDVAPDLALFNVFDELATSDEVQLREEIGRGAFGVVHRGFWRDRCVAVKLVSVGDDNGSALTASAWHEFCNEAHIMSSLAHPCIVRLVAVVAQPPMIVTEMCGGGDLHSFLGECPHSAITSATRHAVALDVARALAYLHGREPTIVHRDVRSPNVFLVARGDGQLAAKLADFGLACHLAAVARDALESWVWMAPETRGTLPLYTAQADVYSFAMVLYHLATHRVPFADALEVQDAWQVERGVSLHNVRPPLDQQTPFCALIAMCWHATPDARPTSAALVTMLEND